MDDVKTELTDNVPEGRKHTDLKPNGQQIAYVVLSEEERAKGFVRPVRRSYVHKGLRPTYPTRELTAEEHERYDQFGYELFEAYPESDSPVTGKFWTGKMLRDGCGGITRMGLDLAETYARDPKFYSGTFCVDCGAHFPIEEFVWDGTDERVGS